MTIHLYDIRTQKGYSQEYLAKLSGVSKTHIREVENGQSNPTIQVLCQLAKALQVPFTDLFSCDDE
jgi:transcriptional regulator with XRE-family HTH domain